MEVKKYFDAVLKDNNDCGLDHSEYTCENLTGVTNVV